MAAMAKTAKYFGLCETCEHDDTCMLRRSSRLEIIQCEEFSILPPESQSITTRQMAEIGDPMEAARLGLCANCLNVVTCGFPNARHGVVHCEEYILDEAGVVSPVKKAEHSQSAA
jgi:hypothetical protein